MGKWSQREYEQQLSAKVRILFDKAFQDPLMDRPEGHDSRFHTFIRLLDVDDDNAKACFRSLIQQMMVDTARKSNRQQRNETMRVGQDSAPQRLTQPLATDALPIRSRGESLAFIPSIRPSSHIRTGSHVPDFSFSVDPLGGRESPSAGRRARTRSASPPSPSAARQRERQSTEPTASTIPGLLGSLAERSLQRGTRDWLDNYALRRERRERDLQAMAVNIRRSQSLEEATRRLDELGEHLSSRRRRRREDEGDEPRMVRQRTAGNLREAVRAARRNGVIFDPDEVETTDLVSEYRQMVRNIPWDEPVGGDELLWHETFDGDEGEGFEPMIL